MRLTPSLTAAALGAGSAWMRKNDVDKARVQLSKQWGTWFEGGAAAVGLFSNSLRLNLSPDLTDSLAIGGLTLFSERVARSAMSGSFGTGSPMSIGGRSYAGAPGMMYVPPSNNYPTRGFAQKEKSATAW